MYKNYTTNQTSLPLEWYCSMLPSYHIIFEIHEFVESADNLVFTLFESYVGKILRSSKTTGKTFTICLFRWG